MTFPFKAGKQGQNNVFPCNVKRTLKQRCAPAGFNLLFHFIGTAGGRQMTDVNVGFISQAYMVYQWTNDTDFFDQIYPYAKRATHWLIHRATKG